MINFSGTISGNDKFDKLVELELQTKEKQAAFIELAICRMIDSEYGDEFNVDVKSNVV